MEGKKDEKPENLGATALKPVGWDRSGLEALRYFIYDPEKGTFLSRTPLSWLKIILFYTIYYCLLALFWLVCLQVFFLTLHQDRPKWTLEESLIGKHPGMGVRPSLPDYQIGSSLYVLAAGSEETVGSDDVINGKLNVDYALRMKQFLDGYDDQEGLVDCSNEPNSIRNVQNCTFDTSILGECGVYPYGYLVDLDKYNVIQPCFLIKINKILDWKPIPINKSDLDTDDFSSMSTNLKNRIRKSIDTNYLWIDCAGRSPADRESLRIEYFPSNQGISLKHFPYQGAPYHQPVLGIKVHQTKGGQNEVAYGQLLHIECRLWYHGVKHNTKDKSGLTQFELMIEPTREL